MNLTVNPGAPFGAPAVDRVQVQALNGTKASSVGSHDANVTLRNLTFGTDTYLLTNAAGFVNLTVPAGWYYLRVIVAGTGAFVNFSANIQVAANPTTETVYLVPSASAIVTVGNGPAAAAVGTIYAALKGSGAVPFAQVTVALLNESSSGAFLASAVTLWNGTAVFRSVDTAFSYALYLEGKAQAATGWSYGLASATSATLTFGSAGDIVYSFGWSQVAGVTATVGSTVTGTAIPNSNATWTIQGPTTVVGGTTYLSGYVDSANPTYTLEFSNAVVYWNFSGNAIGGGGSPPDLVFRLVNSTFISLSSGEVFDPVSAVSFAEHSLLIGTGQSNKSACPNVALPGNVTYSYVADWDLCYGNVHHGGSAYTDDVIWNVTDGQHHSFLAQRLTHDRFFNTTLAWWVSGTNLSYSLVNFAVFGGEDPAGPAVKDLELYEDAFGPNLTASGYFIASTVSSGHFVNCLFNVTSPYGVPFASLGGRVGAPSYYVAFPSVTTISGSRFQIGSLPDVQAFWDFTRTTVTQSVFNSYVGPADLLRWMSNTRYNLGNLPAAGNSFVARTYAWANLTHDTLNDTSILAEGAHSVADHDLLTGFVGQPTVYADNAGNTDLTVTNNVVTTAYENSSLVLATDCYLNSCTPGGEVLLSDTAGSPTYFTFAHNTIYQRWIGTGVPCGFDAWGNVSDNVFWNNATYGPTTTWQQAWAIDVRMNPTNSLPGYVTGNWFLGLNNGTVAIAVNDLIHPTDQVTVTGNHFWFSPLPGQSSVAPMAYPNMASPYALLFGSQATVTLGDQAYVYNASVLGTTADTSGDPLWYWNVTPSVNASSGTPIVSFQGDGGAQPNLPWRGANFSTEVEPTYVRVSTPSAGAASVNAGFNGLAPGWTYRVGGYNSAAALLETWSVTAGETGSVAVPYVPGTIGNTATFAIDLNGTAPPAVGGGFWSQTFLGISTTAWVALGVLVVLVGVAVEAGRRPK